LRIARDAAGRGLSVFLCEMGDLGSGTSSASTRLIHGGLRYLEYREFRLVRETRQGKARAVLTGMTRGTTRRELAPAALECVAYQTRDLSDAMRAALGAEWPGDTVIRVDGGMSASDWTMQFLADILAAPVDRPDYLETTALGAGYLAGMAA
jgi:sugar (pentulose or hexulose) kinase